MIKKKWQTKFWKLEKGMCSVNRRKLTFSYQCAVLGCKPRCWHPRSLQSQHSGCLFPLNPSGWKMTLWFFPITEVFVKSFCVNYYLYNKAFFWDLSIHYHQTIDFKKQIYTVQGGNIWMSPFSDKYTSFLPVFRSNFFNVLQDKSKVSSFV